MEDIVPLIVVLFQLEAQDIEVCEQLYKALVDSLAGNSTYCHRIYFDDDFSRYLIVREKFEHLSQGTTGLSCWQASCDLANYLLKFNHEAFCANDVLELGAGCGLVGIALAATGCPRTVTLSDGSEDVLSLIRDNISINFSQVLTTMLK
ncbi:unnamed protein product [Gongylonema pulchrum]|uniref:FAM86 domain-containing protein n=1 Tax=Gongylonema pulchrum TaxID=637853 RepID=A0A183DA95_9BILA|nr:unnamed protein product [Gongylonema pulchrum]